MSAAEKLSMIECPKCNGRGEYTSQDGDFRVFCDDCEGVGSVVPTGLGHQLQETARSYDSIKSSLELCLRIAVEQKEVKVGSVDWSNMCALIEKYDILATKEMDIYNSKS